MTRVALLPAGADPFLNAYWLRHYRLWADEVDQLVVWVHGQRDEGIRDYLREQVAAVPHAVVRFQPRIAHGTAIEWMVAETDADYIMLCEDDAYVRKAGSIRSSFERIERGEADIVACPRGSATPQVIDAANARFGPLQAGPEGGPLFWPCFFFARRSDLMRTDGQYGARAWRPGEEITGTGVTSTSDNAADTMGHMSLQLRAMGLRVHVEPNYRANLGLMNDWAEAPWFHVGSLSSGYGHYFLADIDPVDRQSHWDSIRNDLYDWNKRVSWWRRVWQRHDGALAEHHAEYGKALDDYMTGTGMNPGDVAQWTQAFDRLVTWE